jgi:hypothetical protein
MIRITPARRITLQCSQIGLTLLRTFMVYPQFIEQLFSIAKPVVTSKTSTPLHAVSISGPASVIATVCSK